MNNNMMHIDETVDDSGETFMDIDQTSSDYRIVDDSGEPFRDIDQTSYDNRIVDASGEYIDESYNYDEGFAPDLAEIIEKMKKYPNEANPEALVEYLVETQWLGIFQLFLPDVVLPKKINRDGNAVEYSKEETKEMMIKLMKERDGNAVEYSKKLITEIKEMMRKFTEENSGQRQSVINSRYPAFNQKLKDFVEQFLKEKKIEYNDGKDQRDKTIDILKDRLRNFIQNDKIDPLLYYMKIDETEELKIQLKYTELGALIMWRTEIPHDLSALSDKILRKIDTVIDKQISKNIKKNMYDGMDGKLIKYTETIATDLCLEILNYNMIPRCIQKHGKSELQFGDKELGQGILPSIYNDTDVYLTSDANNKGNVEFSQVNQTQLNNITGKNVQFLNLDAGAAPTQIGFQESQEERINLESDEREQFLKNLNKPIDISVYNPQNKPMLNIKSNPSDLTQYIITIYSEEGKNPYRLEKRLSNLSISNVINIVNEFEKSDKHKYIFNASILKSLGDLIPYQVVCLQTALLNADNENYREAMLETVNIMGSIDYSMIFQLLGNVQYFKNGNNVTNELNKCRILTGVNFENSNVYFPWSSSEKQIYQWLYYIRFFHKENKENKENKVEEVFNEIKNNVSTILYDYKIQNPKYKHTDIKPWIFNNCITELNVCSQKMKQFPDTEILVQKLKNAIQLLLTIKTEFDKDIKIAVYEKYEEDKIEVSPDIITFDKLDYILAYIISHNSQNTSNGNENTESNRNKKRKGSPTDDIAEKNNKSNTKRLKKKGGKKSKKVVSQKCESDMDCTLDKPECDTKNNICVQKFKYIGGKTRKKMKKKCSIDNNIIY